MSLRDIGHSIVVLEARDRAGGKTWSVPTTTGKGWVDLGATRLNEYTQVRLRSGGAYVKRFNLKVTEQRLGHTALMQVADDTSVQFKYGTTPPFTSEEVKNLEDIRDHIQARSLLHKEAAKHEEDLISVDEYVRDRGAGPKSLEMVNLWTKAMHGLESTQVSIVWCLDFLRRNGGMMSVRSDYKTGGCFQRLNDGAQAVSQRIADLVGEDNIYLSPTVTSIHDLRSPVTVKTANSTTFECRKCVISLPSTTYKELNFTPPLPRDVQELSNAAVQGDYGKAVIVYESPWWIEKGWNGLMMSFSGSVALCKDISVEDNNFWALLCFVNGHKCQHEWSKLYPHDRRALVLRQLALVFDSDEPLKLIEYFDQVWKDEPYSQGCMCPVLAFGHLTKCANVYGKPIGNLHFVGTEYASHWKGHMEGALDSGEHGAREIQQSLRTSKP